MKEEEKEERGLTPQGSGPVRPAAPSSGVLGMDGCKPSRQGWKGIPGRSGGTHEGMEYESSLCGGETGQLPRLAAGTSSGCSLCSALGLHLGLRALCLLHTSNGSLAASPPRHPFSSPQSTSLLSPCDHSALVHFPFRKPFHGAFLPFLLRLQLRSLQGPVLGLHVQTYRLQR